MSPSRPMYPTLFSRATTAALLVAMSVAVLGASGCSWFRKKDYYSMDADKRPLEFPPAFDAAEAERAANIAVGGSVTRSGMTSQGGVASALAFNVPGERSAVYARLGEALAATPGVTIASKAELLGAFDLDYEGQKFLVRVSEASGGSQVSAVDARGQPANNPAALKLIAALRTTLAN